MTFTLIIKRAFGANKVNGSWRPGTSKEEVAKIMSQFGVIDKIDCTEKTDRHNGQKFRVFFVHYKNTDIMEDDARKAFENEQDIEVDNDDKGHFWIVCKYIAKKQETAPKKRSIRIRPKKEYKRPTPPPLEMIEESPSSSDEMPPPAPVSEMSMDVE